MQTMLDEGADPVRLKLQLPLPQKPGPFWRANTEGTTNPFLSNLVMRCRPAAVQEVRSRPDPWHRSEGPRADQPSKRACCAFVDGAESREGPLATSLHRTPGRVVCQNGSRQSSATGGQRGSELCFRWRTSEARFREVDPAAETDRRVRMGKRITTVDEDRGRPPKAEALRLCGGLDPSPMDLGRNVELSEKAAKSCVGLGPVRATLEVAQFDLHSGPPDAFRLSTVTASCSDAFPP